MKFKRMQVKQMLDRIDLYAGMYRYAGIQAGGQHQPIIPYAGIQAGGQHQPIIPYQAAG